MKGIVFTEFLEYVEGRYGLHTVDQIIDNSDLSTNGVYTSIGTYNFSEMLQLLKALSAKTGQNIDGLLLAFGEYFFKVVETNYKAILDEFDGPIDMLASIDDHIHVEVRKIYPNAQLPKFTVVKKEADLLIMNYESSRAMHHFGLGLMNKTFDHFNMEYNILLEKFNPEGTQAQFTIRKLS